MKTTLKYEFHWGMMFLILSIAGCKKNPVDRLVNPIPNGAVPQSSGVFVIYDDELKTGGGLIFIPSGENQSIDLQDQSSPRGNINQISYFWNGGDVGGQHLFAGFSLIVTPDASTFNSATGKDLSAPGYTKVTFLLRGSLSSDNRLRIEGPDDGSDTAVRLEINGSSIGNTWQPVTLTIPTADFNDVKIFLSFSIQYTQPPRTTAAGEGGIIYVDDIHYER